MTAPALDPMPATGLRGWGRRRWWVAAAGATVVGLAIGLPTDVIPNPVFGRPVPVTWWSWPVLVATAVLSGLLLATYVRRDASGVAGGGDLDQLDRPARAGGVAGMLSFFAVGCPVCNKVVVLALGTTGAMEVFRPLQPLLAVVSLALLAHALRRRVAGERACPVP